MNQSVSTAPRGRTPKRRPTMTDVATLAGVSQSSVSFVLNGMTGAKISEKTRLKIMEAVRQLDYALPIYRKLPSPPSTHRAPKGGGRPFILYLVDEISTSPHPVLSVDGARDEAWKNGVLVVVLTTRTNGELELAILDSFLGNPMLLGVIYSTIFTRQISVPVRLRKTPLVLLNCYTPEAGQGILCSVLPSEVLGGVMATEQLISAGHSRIGFINGEPWMDAAKDRLKGYRRALASADIRFDPALVLEADWHMASAYDCTLRLMRLPAPPTAIFCANDLMAAGCVNALQSLGRKVPTEVSVIGYDDQEIARHTHPPLSTVLLPNYEMGQTAVDMLLHPTRGTRTRTRTIKVEGAYIARATIARPL